MDSKCCKVCRQNKLKYKAQLMKDTQLKIDLYINNFSTNIKNTNFIYF